LNKTYRRAAVAVFLQKGSLLVETPEGSQKALDGAGKRIWELLEYPTSGEELLRRLESEFAGDRETIGRDVDRFLKELVSLGLVDVAASSPTGEEAARNRYVWLLKRALVNLIYPEHELRLEYLENPPFKPPAGSRQVFLRDIGRIRPDLLEELIDAKTDGRIRNDFVTRFSHTMVGLARLDNLERCAETVFRENIPGDFLEAGVCQGGAAVFMRGLQVAFGEAHRATWAADSFRGLPQPSAEADIAVGADFSETRQPWLSFDGEAVTENFRRYGLLDENVFLLPGWFSESLTHSPVERLAILRIDADLYQSTRDVLESLYDRVSVGGFVIVDDYGAFAPCKKAVDEFREVRGLREPLNRIDRTGVYWKKRA